MDDESPVLSWYGCNAGSVVLVEDQISAIRVNQDTGHTACALLGTGLNEEKVAEIQRYFRHVLLALDADATGQAFSMARKWGQAFESFRVVILDRDIKDSDVQTVQNLFS
jgi:DNA primase